MFGRNPEIWMARALCRQFRTRGSQSWRGAAAGRHRGMLWCEQTREIDGCSRADRREWTGQMGQDRWEADDDEVRVMKGISRQELLDDRTYAEI